MTTRTHDAHDDDAPGHPGAVAHHATDDHGDEHGHGDHSPDERAHGAGEALGPIDVFAWGAGALGVVLGLVVAVCFILATGPITG